MFRRHPNTCTILTATTGIKATSRSPNRCSSSWFSANSSASNNGNWRAPQLTEMNACDFSEILARVQAEERVSSETLHLTANENVMSDAARDLQRGPLYSRYHLGHVNKKEAAKHGAAFMGLVLKSLPAVHEMERCALRAARQMFGAQYADFRPLSGVHAILVTLAALTSPGDVVYCLRADEA